MGVSRMDGVRMCVREHSYVRRRKAVRTWGRKRGAALFMKRGDGLVSVFKAIA